MNEGLPDVTDYEKQLDKLEKKYREGELSDTTFNLDSYELSQLISEGHNYKFVGRVGEFCPILDGKNGGILVREGKDRFGKVKYDAVNGSKGYRWLESETVKVLEKENDINKEYFTRMVDDAVDDISEFGNIDWFLS